MYIKIRRCRAQPIVSVAGQSIIYGFLSISMVFLNKLILNGWTGSTDSSNPVIPEKLLTIQCAISALAIFFTSVLSKISISMQWADFSICLTGNICFTFMLLSNSYSLKYLPIHMVTLLKCLTVVITAIGDVFFLKNHLSISMWLSLIMILFGSSYAYKTDKGNESGIAGYVWMVISIICSSAYVILTKVLISKRDIKPLTESFWNNLICCMILPICRHVHCSLYSKDCADEFFSGFQKIKISGFLIVLSGFLQLFLNLSIISLIGSTSATSYVVVSSVKKILQVTISLFIYRELTTLGNVIAIVIGVAGSVFYTFLKWREQEVARALKEEADNECLLSSSSSSGAAEPQESFYPEIVPE